jgi:hypothetical protein
MSLAINITSPLDATGMTPRRGPGVAIESLDQAVITSVGGVPLPRPPRTGEIALQLALLAPTGAAPTTVLRIAGDAATLQEAARRLQRAAESAGSGSEELQVDLTGLLGAAR